MFDTYHNIHVQWTEKQVPGSPKAIDILSPFDYSICHIIFSVIKQVFCIIFNHVSSLNHPFNHYCSIIIILFDEVSVAENITPQVLRVSSTPELVCWLSLTVESTPQLPWSVCGLSLLEHGSLSLSVVW